MQNFSRLTIYEVVVRKQPRIELKDPVWILNLDQIEPGTGKIMNRETTSTKAVGQSTHAFSAGTVLYSKLRPYLNKVVLAPEAGLATTELVPIRCDQTKADANYVAHYLRSPIFLAFASATVAGAKMPRMVMTEFWAHELPLPPLPEQRRIAALLDRAEELRRQRKKALGLLDELTRSVFLEMFGWVRRGASRWPMRPFGEVCETRLGKMLDQKQQTGEHPRKYLRNANVQWFSFDLADVFEMDFDERSRDLLSLRPGDLMICEGGEPGRAAVWQGEIEECYFQKALHRARPNSKLALPDYLVWLLWFLADSGELGDFVTSATISHLTGEKLRDMPIPIPPLPLQQEFARRVAAIEALKTTHKQALAKLDELFASLQHRAFRGELTSGMMESLEEAL